MADWIRRLMIAITVRAPGRAEAMRRIESVERRIAAILTAAEANRAQQIVRETGRRRG